MSLAAQDPNDVAARLMNPQQPSLGRKKIHDLTKIAVTKLRIISFTLFLLQAIFVSLLLASVVYIVLATLMNRPYVVSNYQINAFLAFMLSLLFILLIEYLFFILQFKPHVIPSVYLKKILCLPHKCKPQELDSLLEALKSGDIKLRSKRGILPPYIYKSDWAILLFAGAAYKSELRWVGCRWLQSYDGDLELLGDLPVTPSKTSSSAELTSTADRKYTPTLKPQPHELHWILAVPQENFEDFLEKAKKAKSWEHEDGPERLVIVLRAARRYAQNCYENNTPLVVTKMLADASKVLAETIPGGRISLTDKFGDNSKSSEAWIDSVLRIKGSTKTYKPIRQLALSYTQNKENSIP
ncbi:hypothetical protein [Gluconobacter japonicus]|uniref:hypothetical protein n=1 Tax=Gluconobacter japonicus TaxID=376620 RepID=UPI0039EABDFB